MESTASCINICSTDYGNSSRTNNRNDYILGDIVQALDSWTHRIFLLETDLQRNTDIKRDIVDSLQRQVLDGLIKREDAKEIEYILDLWLNLYQQYKCRQIGLKFSEQEILSNLLDLFRLKQISKSFVIRVMLELHRSNDEN